MSTETYQSLHWRETQSGRWERDIDEVEQFYTSLAKSHEGTGRVFFAITGYISVSVAIPKDDSSENVANRLEEALRKAWVRLRFDHPTVASWVEYNREARRCRKIYTTPQDDRGVLTNWVDSTFRIIPTMLSGLEWCNSDPPVPKLPTLFVIASDAHPTNDSVVRRELVFRSHHDIIDGIGTLQLMNNLLGHAAEAYSQGPSYAVPRFGSECANLSPPFRVAAAVPSTLDPKRSELFEKIIAENKKHRQGVEIATLPFKAQNMPGKHQRSAITLSMNETNALLTACKNVGITPTHAYHAAIAIKLRDLQERREAPRVVRYINYCLLNERHQCVAPYNTPKHAAAVYHSVSGPSLVLDLEVPSEKEVNSGRAGRNASKEEFLKVAADVKDFYHGIRDDSEHVPMVPLYWTLSTPHIDWDSLSPGQSPAVPAPNQAPSVSISSMGIIDKIIPPQKGHFILDNPWVTGEELGTGLGLFLGTYKNQLSVSVAFNDAYHSDQDVLEFLKGCNFIVQVSLL